MAGKCTREQLLLLCIEADPSPDVIGRILKQMGGNGRAPVDLLIDRDAKFQRVMILLDRKTAVPSLGLIGQLERSPAVRSVKLIDHMGCSVSPIGRAIVRGSVNSEVMESSRRYHG